MNIKTIIDKKKSFEIRKYIEHFLDEIFDKTNISKKVKPLSNRFFVYMAS